MKVLFAVNNEKVSEAIIKKYQTMYKEIISWKNVYFFNAIIKELQKDKSYDRIVIGEDLEPYANNNYEVIDNFLFDKLDSISDEASNSREGDIPIILIATDRREKGNNILVKLFGIGIYNVLLGKDRSIENVCKLIAQPRTKKEAKIYYKIESDDVEYQAVDPDSVDENEIQNIIRHYKKLGKNEEKYVESFNEIAEQYTDTQLKLITKFLPLNVRAVLEEKCPKYQQVMIGSVKGQVAYEQNKTANNYTTKNLNNKKENKIDLIEQELKKAKLTKPVVIPSSINMQNVKKAYTGQKNEAPENTIIEQASKEAVTQQVPQEPLIENNTIMTELDTELDNTTENKTVDQINNIETPGPEIAIPKKGRGRPKKEKTPEELVTEVNKEKRGRGRPKKVTTTESVNNQEENIDLFGLATEDNVKEEITNTIPNNEETVLPGIDEQIFPGLEETILPGIEENELPGMENFKEEDKQPTNNYNNINQQNEQYNNQQSNQYNELNNQQNAQYNDLYNNQQENQYTNQYSNQQNDLYNTQIENINPAYQYNNNLSSLLTGDKKIVAFVGTSKNGTSFLVNNLAALLSSRGINTAILDLAKNKNSYYIYTQNEEVLRNKAFNCINGLRRGVADGIQVNKNLTVYTTLPGEDEELNDYGNILETLAKNYSLILLDCDFETNTNYFAEAQELYLVQTYDILTIQPLTEFLNELNHKNILDQNKLRIVINKTLKLRKLTERMIIGGISCYNDPASTFINTLFNKDTVRYTTIPFEDATYARYLERLVDCEISLNGYSKIFLEALNKLSDMVYPLIASKNKYEPNKNYNDYNKKSNTFNSDMNATLNKMRKNF